jgi:predicted nucleic acid-binding protein
MEYLLRTERAPPVIRVIESADTDVHVPALCDIEVGSALSRALRAGVLAADRAAQALRDYQDLPITRHGHLRLLSAIVALRENFSAYDAAYVVLAESLGASLLTADERLAHAVLTRTGLVTLSSS